MLVGVRAMAPVAGSPPNKGETMLATPWPMSSTLGLWRSLLMRSETTADIRDSMAPSMATVRAGPRKPWMRSARNRGTTKWGKPAGIPPKREPMVSTGSLNRMTAAVPSRKATIAPGIRLEMAPQRMITRTVPAASAVAVIGKRVEARGQSFHAQPEDAWNFGELQAEEILDLGAGDQDGDAIGEADDDG